MMISLSAHNLNLWYGAHQALHSVNLEVQSGKITALIGPSGCGKSTFLRCFNRMNDLIPGVKIEGSLHLGDLDLTAPSLDLATLRRRVGMVFQRPNPFPMSLYDNVAYGPRLQGLKKGPKLDALVARCLENAGLWDEVKDKLKTPALALSGGQQQRLCVARALATEPEVLLMDEPTSALDPKATHRIEELCRSLKGSYTIVIVTHNMQQAARLADETAFFYEGRLIEAGPTARLFTAPEKQQTGDYITGRFG